MVWWQKGLFYASVGLNCSRAVIDGLTNTLRSVEREIIAAHNQAERAKTLDEQVADAMQDNPDTFDMDPRDTYS